ncbi:MAG: aromatic amino acid ammonia-lyase [Thermoprotei archaeon]
MIMIGNELGIRDIINVSRKLEKVSLSEDARNKIRRSRRILEQLISSNVKIYGVNTGLGELYNVSVKPDDIVNESINLLIEHAMGIGESAPKDWVRATILIRAHQLSLGYSGVRETIVDQLLEFLNKNVIPVVPKYGSVGASGDLAPLSHIALALVGKGYVQISNSITTSEEALKKLGIEPLKLSYKEAISLINGTSYSAGVSILGLYDSLELVKAFIAIFTLILDSINTNISPCTTIVNSIKKHKGQLAVAKTIEKMLKDKEINIINRVQDPYSIRCIPQIVGPILDSLLWSISNVINEINSASDNPVIINSSSHSSCHFHGEYIALSTDLANESMTILGNLIERLITQLLRADINKISNYLAKSPSSVGYMITQYTAASLTSKLRELAVPSTIHNIPTSGVQEDVNSMSANSAVKLHEVNLIISQLISILALITYLISKDKKLTAQTQKIYETIKASVENAHTFQDTIKKLGNVTSELAEMIQLENVP